MLIIKGIRLLLSHLPTSHTIVQAVPHTVVSNFLILRCVARTTKDSQGGSHLLLHSSIQSFPIGTRTLGTMASADFSRQVYTYFIYTNRSGWHYIVIA